VHIEATQGDQLLGRRTVRLRMMDTFDLMEWNKMPHESRVGAQYRDTLSKDGPATVLRIYW